MERNEAREVSVFGGQGVASGQLAELRRISQVDEVRRFVKYLSGIFEREMARNGRRCVPQGLNVSQWAVSKELSPEMAYLETLPVSVVLTFTIQLATFRYCWTKNGFGDDVVPSSGTVGHSQGLAAAMVTALAKDYASFEQLAGDFGTLLLTFGLCAADRLQTMGNSCALGVLKADVGEVVAASERFEEETGSVGPA